MLNGGFMLFFNFTQKSSFAHFLLLIWSLNTFGCAQNYLPNFLQRIPLKMQRLLNTLSVYADQCYPWKLNLYNSSSFYFDALSCGTRLANTSSLNRMYGNTFNLVSQTKPCASTIINNIDTLNMQIKNENFQEMEAFTKEKYQTYHAPQFDLGTYKAFKAILPSIIFEIKKYKNKEINIRDLNLNIYNILAAERIYSKKLFRFFWFHMFGQEQIQIEKNKIDIQVIKENKEMEAYEPIYFSFIESFIGLKESL